jgi:hypothetical protein
MRSDMNPAVLALAASIISSALSAPIQYRYGNLLVEFKGRAFLISGIPRDPDADNLHSKMQRQRRSETGSSASPSETGSFASSGPAPSSPAIFEFTDPREQFSRQEFEVPFPDSPGTTGSDTSVSNEQTPPGLIPEDPPHATGCCGGKGGCVIERSKQQHC